MAAPRYPNGRYPLNLFVHRGGDLYLSPSLNARWNEAVRIGLEKYGVRLYITGPSSRGWDGANGYRWYERQVTYKNAFGEWAASPGTSSHGGVYRGQEVFAVDVSNWANLAPGNRSLAWSRFVAIMKAVGLTTDFVSPREEWHVGDFNNAWVVPTFGNTTVKPGTTNKPKPATETYEEYDMEMNYIYNRTPYDRVYAINPITGKKRALPKAEWEAAKLAGARYYVATKAQADEVPNA
ncbi:endolysin [Microbacterium phage Jacko]|nr:endolysin [Microbacterium phage Jacko]